jgi:hypothetical protein
MFYKTGDCFFKNGANQEKTFPDSNDPIKATWVESSG